MPDSLPRRLARYQAERFPLVAYLPLLGVAAFAAVGVSAAGRGASALPWAGWAVATVTLVLFFFFLRALDEHKDAAEDRIHRPELPVPRGLVTLAELRRIAAVGVGLAIVLNAVYAPAVLVPLAVALAWAGLMGREFFVRDWLRERHLAYLLSHMVVMPLVFFYATSLDWLAAYDPVGPAASPSVPPGVGAFLVLSFLNGLVIEIGRKIRAPGAERPGVDTYTAVWGAGLAAGSWVAAIAGAAAACVVVTTTFGFAQATPAVILLLALLAALPGAATATGRDRGARWVEPASAVWVLGSYGVIAVVSFLVIRA